MEILENVTLVIEGFTALIGLILIFVGYFSKIEKAQEKKTIIVVGWTLFIGSIALIIQKLM